MIIYHRPTMRSILVFSSLFLLGCFSAQFNLTLGANTGCKHRDYGHESTVCVCNEHYCDSLEPIRRTAPLIVQTYSTSRDGDRFAREDLHFTNATVSPETTDRRVIRLQSGPVDQEMNRIIGFGGALSDATGYNFFQLPPKLRENLIRDYFGDHGIEYSSIRVTIGGSDMSTREYSDDDHDGDDFNLDHFQLQPEDLKYKIPFLHMAQQATPQHRPLKLFGSAWSPPAWMKTNHKLDHGGRIKGEPGGKYYNAFAKYLLKFLREYQQRNVTWWGMTVVNEPDKFEYNSLEMSAEQQRDFIKKDLGPELHREGLAKIQLMIYDWNVPKMRQFVDTVLSDPAAAKYVAGIAYHWYETNDQNRAELKQIHQKYPDKFILATEACENFRNDSLGAWHVAQHYAQNVIRDLLNKVNGWTDWNMILDLNGGPSWFNQTLDSPIIVNVSAGEYYKQPSFYVLGHFSKFVPPGSGILYSDGQSFTMVDDVIAFLRPDGGFVLTILNNGNETENYTVTYPPYGSIKFPVKDRSIKTLLWYF